MSTETMRWKRGAGKVRPLSTAAGAIEERRRRENAKALRYSLRAHIDANGVANEELARAIGLDYMRLVAILAAGVPTPDEALRITTFLGAAG